MNKKVLLPSIALILVAAFAYFIFLDKPAKNDYQSINNISSELKANNKKLLENNKHFKLIKDRKWQEVKSIVETSKKNESFFKDLISLNTGLKKELSKKEKEYLSNILVNYIKSNIDTKSKSARNVQYIVVFLEKFNSLSEDAKSSLLSLWNTSNDENQNKVKLFSYIIKWKSVPTELAKHYLDNLLEKREYLSVLYTIKDGTLRHKSFSLIKDQFFKIDKHDQALAFKVLLSSSPDKKEISKIIDYAKKQEAEDWHEAYLYFLENIDKENVDEKHLRNISSTTNNIFIKKRINNLLNSNKEQK